MVCPHSDRKVKAKGLCGSCYNKEYHKQKGKPKRRHIPEAARRRKLRHRYGIETEDYDKMVLHQESCCKVCKTKTPYNLYVDHDHETGKVRQLLCARCNTIAGSLEDNNCMKVIEYLREHSSNALARLELMLREREAGEAAERFFTEAGKD